MKHANSLRSSKDPKSINLLNEIIEFTKFLPENAPIKARFMVIINDISELPKCECCSNTVLWNKAYPMKGFTRFCSKECRQLSNIQISIESKNKLSNKTWLETEYETKTIDEISNELNVSSHTVWYQMKNFDINRINRNHLPLEITEKLKDKKFFISEYIDNNKSLNSIAEELNIESNAVWRYFNTHNIDARDSNEYPRKINKRSLGEIEIEEFITSLGFTVETSNRTLLENGQEIDIIVHEKKFGVEFNGIFYHSEEYGKDKNYHLNKTKIMNSKDYSLIHIFDSEWNSKKDLWKSMISNKLGLSNKIYARKCSIKLVDNQIKNSFLNENHNQGSDFSSIKIGLHFDDELVSILTMVRSRFNKQYDWELSRFASKKYTIVVGGFSKLLKFFTRNYTGSIITYANKRYSEGNLYLVNGFKELKDSKPNYFYTKNDVKLESRNKFQKHKLEKLLPVFYPSESESTNMKINGYKKIWDCGNKVFILKKES